MDKKDKEQKSQQQTWPRCLVCAQWHDPKKPCAYLQKQKDKRDERHA